MALGRIVFKTHQRRALLRSQSNQLIKGRLAFRCSQDIAVFRDGRLVAAPRDRSSTGRLCATAV
jgi:hypothetical protein